MNIFLLIALSACTAFAVPHGDYRPSDNNNNAYTGGGGDANGGSVLADASKHGGGLLGLPSLINVLSNNGGDGGEADSGHTLGGASRLNSYPENEHNSGNAYSGNGGHASGGSVHGVGGLVNILSNNAGHAGSAISGSSQGGGRIWRRWSHS